MLQCIFNRQFYTPRVAAVFSFQELLNNTDIHKDSVGCGPRESLLQNQLLVWKQLVYRL